MQIGDPFAGEAPDRGVARADRAAGCWRGCRTSAAPASRARSASRPRAPGWAPTSTSTRCRCASAGMEPFEILTSESQERMLAIVHPSKLADVRAVCERWGLDVRRDRDARRGARSRSVDGGEIVAAGAGAVARRRRARVRPADGAGPTWPRSRRRSRVRRRSRATCARRSSRVLVVAERRRASDGSSSSTTRCVQGQTVAGAGTDAAVVRVPGTLKGVALSTRRQGPLRRARPVPGRGARRRRGRAQRRGHRRQAARHHELHELRQPGAARGDVAVRRSRSGAWRDACRALETPGHRRQRQLLQRVRRLRDLAHAGDRTLPIALWIA